MRQNAFVHRSVKIAGTFLLLLLFGSAAANPADAPAEPAIPPTFGADAEVVVYAKVLDSSAFARAGQNQNYVAKNQGWAAIKVEVERVNKGRLDTRIAWIDNVQVASVRTREREWPNGAFFHLALRRNEELSRWCEADVFDLLGISPDRPRFRVAYFPHFHSAKDSDTVVVHVGAEGVRIGDEDVAFDVLASYLEAYVASTGARFVVMAQRPDTPFKAASRVIDACRSLTISALIITEDDLPKQALNSP